MTTESADDVETSPRQAVNADRLVCACSGLTERDILTAFQRVGASFERLVTETGVGSKCTACMLDVDLLLDGVVRAQRKDTKKGEGAAVSGLFLRPDDQTNCGHFVLENGLSTILRVANLGLMFNRETPIVDYTWRLIVFSTEGKVLHRRRGRLNAHETIEIDFATIPGITSRGWFIIDLLPLGKGVVASLRPQIGILGPDWVSAYHPQWLAFRTRRRGILVHADDGFVDLAPVLINVEESPAQVTVNLFGTNIEYKDAATATIPPRGMIQFECAKEFSAPQGRHSLICTIEADRPLNYFVVNKHRDGSWCVDHFPNEK